jgi:hypothetical protein
MLTIVLGTNQNYTQRMLQLHKHYSIVVRSMIVPNFPLTCLLASIQLLLQVVHSVKCLSASSEYQCRNLSRQHRYQHLFSHRHPDAHSCCVQELSVKPKHAEARELLSKHFPASSKSRTLTPLVPKVPTDPKKFAQYQKVELMKMRHRAIPGNPQDRTSSPPIDQRLHVNVRVDPEVSGDGEKERSFWFRKVPLDNPTHIVTQRSML